MNSKSYYRLYAKNIRKSLNIADISKKAVELVRDNEMYKSAQNVMIYYPLKDEIDLRELLRDEKKFFLPKVFDRDILVCPFDGELKKSALNIMEPCSEAVSEKCLDLVIVPALMADKNGIRLGYGGGFYDRFLSKNSEINSITVISEKLFVENLPVESTDVKIKKILVV